MKVTGKSQNGNMVEFTSDERGSPVLVDIEKTTVRQLMGQMKLNSGGARISYNGMQIYSNSVFNGETGSSLDQPLSQLISEADKKSKKAKLNSIFVLMLFPASGKYGYDYYTNNNNNTKRLIEREKLMKMYQREKRIKTFGRNSRKI